RGNSWESSNASNCSGQSATAWIWLPDVASFLEEAKRAKRDKSSKKLLFASFAPFCPFCF
ncbi:MAG: hypothetical protein J2P31_06980, partial [Blastocatellia bacterium]|nr:hypothetical protein [Blastocatellia bacterium]